MEILTESRIVGAFKGWQGRTEFELENGQVWQQCIYDTKDYYLFKPKVTIYIDARGNAMQVDGIPDVVFVERIR